MVATSAWATATSDGITARENRPARARTRTISGGRFISCPIRTAISATRAVCPRVSGSRASVAAARASALATRGQGTPIVVYNQLNVPREDIAEANVVFPGGVPQAVRVARPDGRLLARPAETAEQPVGRTHSHQHRAHRKEQR